MTPEQSRAIAALQGVTFVPASGPKRFARDIAYATELSPRQDKYLWWVTYRFRRQIRDKEIVEYARLHMVPLDQLPPPAKRKAKVKAVPKAAPIANPVNQTPPSDTIANAVQETLPL